MKKFALAILLPFFGLLFIDQMTKMYAVDHSAAAQLNAGIITGMLQTAPELYRRVFTATIFGLLIFIFAFTQSIVIRKSTALAITLSIFFSGITGNAIDRMFSGAVVDFIKLGTLLINMADLFQWLGLAGSIAVLTIERNRIFHPYDARTRFLINPQYQIRTAGKYAFASVVTAFLMGIFSYTFLLSVNASTRMPTSLEFFSRAYILISLLFGVIVFLAGLFITQKTAGPIYAFNRFVDEMIEGKMTVLKLRAGDDFKSLEATARKLLESFHAKK